MDERSAVRYAVGMGLLAVLAVIAVVVVVANGVTQ